MDWTELFPPGEPVIALPNWERPRLLLSARAPDRRWRDSGFYPAHRLSAKGYKFALRWRAMAGMGDVRQATGARWATREFLAGIVENPLPPVVQIGTACAAQKCTMRICDSSGSVVAYIKWGMNAFAMKRLRNEFEILSALPLGFGPRPLKFGPLAGGHALCIEPLPGKHIAAVSARWRGHMADFLERLSIHTPVATDSHPAFQRLVQDAPPTVVEWVNRLSDSAWPIVIEHGDLAPWNLMAAPDKAGFQILTALDWEQGILKGAPFFDAAYYALQVAGLIEHRNADDSMEYAIYELCRKPWPALSESDAEAITALVAYQAWRTAMEDGDSPQEPIQLWQRAIWDRSSARGQLLVPAATNIAVARGRVMRRGIESAA